MGDKIKLISRILAIALFFIIVDSVRANSNTEKILREELSTLQLSRVKLRIKLLQEDKELNEINERLVKLQKKLAEQLEINPKMQVINRRVREIEQKLKGTKSEKK